jgi:hypothetical protein
MPKYNRIREGYVDIDSGNMVVERGPKLMKAKATPEILSDAVTASHYHLPKPLLDDKGKQMKTRDGKPALQYARDAKGKLIKEGEQFEYLDWNNPDRWTWYIYKKGMLPQLDATGQQIYTEEGEPVMREGLIELGTFDGDEEGALKEAARLGK